MWGSSLLTSVTPCLQMCNVDIVISGNVFWVNDYFQGSEEESKPSVMFRISVSPVKASLLLKHHKQSFQVQKDLSRDICKDGKYQVERLTLTVPQADLVKGTTDVHITAFLWRGFFCNCYINTYDHYSRKETQKNWFPLQVLSLLVQSTYHCVFSEPLSCWILQAASATRAGCVGKSSAGWQPGWAFPPFLKTTLQGRPKLYFSVGKWDDEAIKVVKRPVTIRDIACTWNNLM